MSWHAERYSTPLPLFPAASALYSGVPTPAIFILYELGSHPFFSWTFIKYHMKVLIILSDLFLLGVEELQHRLITGLQFFHWEYPSTAHLLNTV